MKITHLGERSKWRDAKKAAAALWVWLMSKLDEPEETYQEWIDRQW